MANSSAKSAREKAAEARAAAEAADRRRRTLINIVIGAVLVVVVVALVGGAFLTKRNSQDDQNPQANATAAMPTGALPLDSPSKGGIPIAAAGAGAPVLEIWEDFQCPACKAFEDAFGPTIDQLARAGDVQAIWRTTSFLDARYPGQNSQRAAAAWGCAIDAGKKVQYHNTIYANQPATEGQGYTDQQLADFATTAGITGAARQTFDTCVANKTYMGWAANGTAWMQDAQVPGTPGLYLNGQKLPDSALASVDAFKKAIQDAGAPTPAPSQ